MSVIVSKRDYKKYNERKAELEFNKREARRKAGICVKCGRIPTSPPYSQCGDCRKRRAKTVRNAARRYKKLRVLDQHRMENV